MDTPPDLVLSLGESGSVHYQGFLFRFEASAYNLKSCESPGVDCPAKKRTIIDLTQRPQPEIPLGMQIHPGWPTRSLFTLPIPNMYCGLNTDDRDVILLGDETGDYVCNDLSYRLSFYFNKELISLLPKENKYLHNFTDFIAKNNTNNIYPGETAPYFGFIHVTSNTQDYGQKTAPIIAQRIAFMIWAAFDQRHKDAFLSWKKESRFSARAQCGQDYTLMNDADFQKYLETKPLYQFSKGLSLFMPGKYTNDLRNFIIEQEQKNYSPAPRAYDFFSASRQ